MAADPKIVAERVHDGDHGVPDAIRTLLKVGPTEVVGYRHVRLRCGAHVLSDADNWYVPGRLTAAINRQLDTTDIPFGRAAKPLQFRRFTLASKHVWSPLPADWATLPVSQWPVQAALELHDYMRTAGNGQHTFDMDLLTMFRQELISHHEAMLHATNPESLNMALRGISSSKGITEPGKPTHAGQPKPVVKPPARRISYRASASSSTEFGNWSVSQPFW